MICPPFLPRRAPGHAARVATPAAANGKTETWVADRTGHKASEMINRYRRRARTHDELGLGPVAPLVDAIPELAEIHARHAAENATDVEAKPTLAHPRVGHRVGQSGTRGPQRQRRHPRITQRFRVVPKEGLEPSSP